jgi:N-methylhydantoinase A
MSPDQYMKSTTKLRIAVDIGGTFTDVAVAGKGGAILATTKTPTTPENPTDGALTGTRRALNDIGAGFDDVSGFIHGTTLATNALIERRGARVAAVTTQGFRDILEIAYERRYDQYDINLEKPDLIVPRSRCFTVPERISARGDVLTPLDEAALDRLIGEIDLSGAEAISICLLHAYANPSHEQRLGKMIAARRPALFISLSSEVSPEAREFDRLCTTIANAYIQPLMATYLAQFAKTLAAEGLRCPILMMTSGGGMTTVETARRLPIRLVESGPSGGAVLAAKVAERIGLGRVLSFDMGGTTAKLCLIDDHQPQTSRRFEIARAARFIKGSGMPIRIPVVEMIEIGAGGGSIAGVDSLGRLTVGPQSAGADPGPAAFGHGGQHATVTDADVALGYIDPVAFAEGRLRIDTKAASLALETTIGTPLCLTSQAAALGVSQIVDENMAGAGRMHAVESGTDLSERTMIAFGGNGPLHATRVARRADVRTIIIPRNPSVGSAIGFLDAPVSFEIVRSRYATLADLDIAGLNAFFAAMITEAQTVVRSGAPNAGLQTRCTAFMRYHGQGHEIEIALPDRDLVSDDTAHLTHLFETAYRAQFSRSVPGMTIEILNWAVRVSTAIPPGPAQPPTAPCRRVQPTAHRTVACDQTGAPVTMAIYQRGALIPGDILSSPALVVEPQTTTLVSAGFNATVDVDLNLILTRENPAEART